MPLKLMYITNNPKIAKIAENAGVDRIFIDMEYIGKSLRQGGMDTIQNHHTVEDVRNIKEVVSKSEVLVRINPIHEKTTEYCSSKEEIDSVIEAGADIIMLPYFKTVEEIKKLVKYVNGRAQIYPLLESKGALDKVDDILEVDGINGMHIGLNDLSLDLKKKFMFELMIDGTVEMLCEKFKSKDIPYGIGGIGRLGKGDLPAEYIIKEHYRLGSSCAILSRSFCNTNLITDLNEIKSVFDNGVKEIRNLEKICMKMNRLELMQNREKIKDIVENIVGKK